MINPQVLDYINKQRAQGMNDVQIRQNLASQGWTEGDIFDTFNSLGGVQAVSVDALSPIRETFRQTFDIFKSHLTLYLSISAVLAVLIVVWGILFPAPADGSPADVIPAESIPLFFLFIIIMALVGVVSQVMMVMLTMKRNENHSFSELLNSSYSKIGGLLWTDFLTGLVVFVGFLLLIVPGIYLMIATIFSSYIFLDQGIKGWPAIKKSREYVKGHWGSIAARLVALIVPCIIASIILSIPAAGTPVLMSIFDGILNLFVMPFAVIYFTLIYEQIRGKKPELSSNQPNPNGIYS
jgi:hypothetical protein